MNHHNMKWGGQGGGHAAVVPHDVELPEIRVKAAGSDRLGSLLED